MSANSASSEEKKERLNLHGENSSTSQDNAAQSISHVVELNNNMKTANEKHEVSILDSNTTTNGEATFNFIAENL